MFLKSNWQHLKWILSLLSTITLPYGKTNGSTDSCTLFMAQSTIPNAGIGVFTAVDINEGGSVGYPDLAIPVTDVDWHNGGSRQEGDYHWLWKNYDWLSAVIGHLSFEAEEVVACIPGIGAMPNCHFRLSNVRESFTHYDTAGLHRSKHPGAGAFSGFHGREAIALKDISAGSEIFVDYGEHWFALRENTIGLVPVAESYVLAEPVLEKFHALDFAGNAEAKIDLWDLLRDFSYKSKSLAALPKTIEASIRAVEVGIKQTELEQSIRSIDWLRKNGKCLDNLRPGISTIDGAGRGAFATRFISKDDIVAPAPLVHIPFKDAILLFGEMPDKLTPEGFTIRNTNDIRGKQLLLNYCFGHSKSTLLLCPYGSGTAYINHNHQTPNVKIVWSEASKALIHNATWLNQSVDFLEDQLTPGLEFDFIALRDIQPNEEVLLDYGKEWNDAWASHVSDWKQVENADDFVDASQLNCRDEEDCKHIPLVRTFQEQKKNPYPNNIWVWCYFNYDDDREMIWNDERDEWRNWGPYNGENKFRYPCNPLSRDDQSRRYTVKLKVPVYDDYMAHVDDIYVEVLNVPQWGIQIVNTQYSSDMFLSNAFRHELMVPDNIFPISWMNLI